MDIGEVLGTLERLLSNQNWTEASTSAKMQVVEVLNHCKPALGPPALESWYKKIGVCFDITPKQVELLSADPEGMVRMLQNLPDAKAKKPEPYPKTGWIGDYILYTQNNEAPTSFHFWVAVSVIGGALRRSVAFDKAHYMVYPNHFILLIAPSGRCRKSTAISIGVKLLKKAKIVNILAEKITPEALIEALARGGGTENSTLSTDCSGFIHAPELAVFLGKQMYNEGLVALLTGLSDNPPDWEYRTRTKATVKLTNVNLSMLGASTPDWLYDSIPQSAFGGGFMSRILFVVANRTDRVLPFPPPEDAKLGEDLVKRLLAYHNQDTQFTNSPDGLEWYTAWYQRIAQERLNIDDPKLSGYFERKPDHLIRLAMILTVSQGEGNKLTAEVYQQALLILDTLEVPMPDAFVAVGESMMGTNSRRVLKQLQAAGGKLDHSSLLQKNYRHMDKDQFRKCMETLQEASLIEVTKVGRKLIYLLLKNMEEV